MNMYRDKVRRIAIVDFDVHHGNGTEETVRWLTPGLDHAEIKSPFALGMIATPRYKPWFDTTDHENVMFVSVHGFGPREKGLEYAMPAAAFYPGTGATHFPSPRPSPVESQATGASSAASAVQLSGEDAPRTVDPVPEFEAEDSESESDADFDPNQSSQSDIDQCDVSVSDDGDEPAVLRATRSIASGKLPSKLAQSIQLYLPKTQPYCNAAASTTPDSSALVLDVGVSLPSEDESPGSYRHEWRNYFR
jgi:hypothetical protein